MCHVARRNHLAVFFDDGGAVPVNGNRYRVKLENFFGKKYMTL